MVHMEVSLKYFNNKADNQKDLFVNYLWESERDIVFREKLILFKKVESRFQILHETKKKKCDQLFISFRENNFFFI